MLNDSLKRFRWVAFFEGTSFLILIFVTMPLKYGMNMPEPNKVIGMFHGVLTVLYVISLLDFAKEYKQKFKRVALLFIASLLPFGTFYADRKWLQPLA